MQTLFFVDDNAVMQSFFKLRYSQLYDIHCFSDGSEALKAARTSALYPDLILLDLDMPGMNGIELAEHIQRSSLLQSIPMIVLSGKMTSEQRIKALEAGVLHLIEKPFNPVEMDYILRKYLNSPQSLTAS